MDKYDRITTQRIITDDGQEWDLLDDLTPGQVDAMALAFPMQKAAMLLGITEAQLDGLHGRGEIVILDVGGERIVPRSEIDRYRAGKGQGPV